MQTVFSRNEKKYLVTKSQANKLISVLSAYMKPDTYSTYWVQNLYFDTENWDIIQNSMEKPNYKEKIRLRCYGTQETTDRMFLEFKKKYSGVVYKRRLPILPSAILQHSIDEILSNDNSQIARELAYHIQRTGVTKRFYIAYYRQAFAGINNDEGLRITIDSNISYRLDTLCFTEPERGNPVLEPNTFLLEIKTPINIPLWLAHLLSELEIFPTSFSKYATCFTDWTSKQSNESLLERQVNEIA